jgi:hypothetical protein
MIKILPVGSRAPAQQVILQFGCSSQNPASFRIHANYFFVLTNQMQPDQMQTNYVQMDVVTIMDPYLPHFTLYFLLSVSSVSPAIDPEIQSR